MSNQFSHVFISLDKVFHERIFNPNIDYALSTNWILFAFYQQDQYIGYSGAIPEKNVTQPNFPLFFIPNAGKYGPETLRVRTLFMQ